jgi:hypothetical protein
MGDDVLQESMAPSLAEQVRRRDQHAGRGNTVEIVGYEDMDAVLRQVSRQIRSARSRG